MVRTPVRASTFEFRWSQFASLLLTAIVLVSCGSSLVVANWNRRRRDGWSGKRRQR